MISSVTLYSTNNNNIGYFYPSYSFSNVSDEKSGIQIIYLDIWVLVEQIICKAMDNLILTLCHISWWRVPELAGGTEKLSRTHSNCLPETWKIGQKYEDTNNRSIVW